MKVLRLGNHCLKIGSGATPRGGKESYLDFGPYTLIRSQNVYNDRFSQSGIVYISEDQAAALANVAVEPNDVLVNITGDSVARVCQVDPAILPARVNQHVAIVRPDPARIDPVYLRYWFVSREMQQHLLALASAGATRPALTKAMLENLSFPDIEIDVQRRSASILSALDDKIELNRRMNETLEAQARALFRDWFVDFGPVKAKMTGDAPYLAPDLWFLFPDRLDDDGVPEGWSLKPLDEVANFLNGLALQKFPAEDGEPSLPVIKIAELRTGPTEKSNRASMDVPQKYIIGDGDFIFSWSGSLLAKFWTHGAGALNQHLFKVTSDTYPVSFYSQWVWHHLAEFQMIAASKATTMGHIQRGHLKAAMCVIPPSHVLQALSAVVEPLVDRTIANELESRTLAQTRDLLLPNLMSGEIRVGEAESAVAAAA